MQAKQYSTQRYDICRPQRRDQDTTVNWGGRKSVTMSKRHLQWTRTMCPVFRGQVMRQFLTHKLGNEVELEFLMDLKAGHAALTLYMGSSFFNWEAGSHVLFWRWQVESRRQVRDWIKPYYITYLPSNKKGTYNQQKEGHKFGRNLTKRSRKDILYPHGQINWQFSHS